MRTHLATANVRIWKTLHLLIISLTLISRAVAKLNSSSTSTSPLASSSSKAHLNITAFGGIGCDGGVITPTNVVIPQGRCSEFPSVASAPNDPIANPILHGYVSCCYLWDARFRSISLQNSDPHAFDDCTLTQFNGFDCDNGVFSTSAGQLDKANICMRTVIDSGNDGLASNNQGVFALRVDCVVTNSSSLNASESLGVVSFPSYLGTVSSSPASSALSASSTSAARLTGDAHPVSTGRPSILGSNNSSTTSPSLPAGCPASVRPSTHSLSGATLNLITYVTRLEPISATITTTVTLKDKNDMYVPEKLFTVTGPTTPYATITQEIAPGKYFGPVDNSYGKSYGATNSDYCQGSCGTCSIYFPIANVLYWPMSSMNTACLENKTTIASQTTRSPGLIKRLHPSSTDGSDGQTVSNGYTFISPSVYLLFPTVSAVDDCGIRGSTHTSVTIAVATEHLSSVVAGFPEKLNIADLLCQPASLSPGGSYWKHGAYYPPISFLGEGYKPMISPPPEIVSLDPTWGGCVVDVFEGKDPPRALTPVAVMTPGTTTESAKAEPTPPSPSSMPLPVASSTQYTTSAAKAESTHNVEPSGTPHLAPYQDPTSLQKSKQLSELNQSNYLAQTPTPSVVAGDSGLETTTSPPPHQSTNHLTKAETPVSTNKDSQQPAVSIANTGLTDVPSVYSTQPAVTTAIGSLSTKSNDPSYVVGSQAEPLASEVSTIVVGGVSLAIGGLAGPKSAAESLQNSHDPTMSISKSLSTPESRGPDSGSETSTITVGGLVLAVGPTAPTDSISTGGSVPQSSKSYQVASEDPSVAVESPTQAAQGVVNPDGTPNIKTPPVASPSLTSSDGSLAGGVSPGSATLVTASPAIASSGNHVSQGIDGIVIGAQSLGPEVISLVAGAGSSLTTGPSLDGHPASSGSGVNLAAGETLSMGAPALTISGTPISLGTGGLVIGSQRYTDGIGPLIQASAGSSGSTVHHVITANPTGFSIAGTTLLPGSPGIRLSGTPVSLNPSGRLVVGTSTLGAMPGPVTTDIKQSSTDNQNATTPNVQSSNVPANLTSSGMSTRTTNAVEPPGNGSSGSGGLGNVILSGFGPSSSTTAASASVTSTQPVRAGQHRTNPSSLLSIILVLGTASLCI